MFLFAGCNLIIVLLNTIAFEINKRCKIRMLYPHSHLFCDVLFNDVYDRTGWYTETLETCIQGMPNYNPSPISGCSD